MKILNAVREITAGVLLLAVPAQAVIVYVNPAPLVGNEIGVAAGPQVLGMDFQVNNPGYVTALGAFDHLGDGFFSGGVSVAIYSVATGLPVTPFVPFLGFAGPLVGSSRFIPIVPVLLGVGTYSIVAANYGAVLGTELNWNRAYDGLPFFPNPTATPPLFDSAGGDLGMLSHRNGSGAFLPGTIPTGTGYTTTDPAFAAGTFAFTAVPEVTTFGVAAIGLLGLVYFGRSFLTRHQLA